MEFIHLPKRLPKSIDFCLRINYFELIIASLIYFLVFGMIDASDNGNNNIDNFDILMNNFEGCESFQNLKNRKKWQVLKRSEKRQRTKKNKHGSIDALANVPPPVTLNLYDYHFIRSTDLNYGSNSVFGQVLPNNKFSTELLFSKMVKAAWKQSESIIEHGGKNITKEKLDKYEFPFIICSTNKMSSIDRIQSISEHFEIPINSMELLMNAATITCVILRSLPSIAKSARFKMIVTPVSLLMKLQVGTLKWVCENSLQDNNNSDVIKIERSSNKIKKSHIKVYICVGRILSKDHIKQSSDNVVKSALQFLSSKNYECAESLRSSDVFSYRRSNNGFIVTTSNKIVSQTCLKAIIGAFADDNRVCWVEPWNKVSLLNDRAQWIVQSGTEDYKPWYDLELRGKGQVVAVSDTGLHTDSCYFFDSTGTVAKERVNAPVDMTKRKIVQYVAHADSFDDSGHGTHVAGTIVGNRLNSDGDEIGSANGIAQDAKISFFDMGYRFENGLFLPDTVEELLDPGRNAGAFIHNASWGQAFAIAYSSLTREFDNYLHENDDFLLVMPAGNSGDTDSAIVNPALGKNVLTVGATETFGDGLRDQFGRLDPSMMGFDFLAHFSSRGPTPDGRIKPEILAPGFSLNSAETNEQCGTFFQAGTSMASPVVAAVAALIREYFEEGYYPTGVAVAEDTIFPSASLIKAILLNGAQSITGVNKQPIGEGILPTFPYDRYQGFGRISLLNSLRLVGANVIRSIVIDRQVLSPESKFSTKFSIDHSTDCTEVEASTTLVWLDPAGSPGCTRCLINNLDLTLENAKTGIILYPNGLTEKDTINNAERIRVTNVNDGDMFFVHVEASDIVTPQYFSLVITGCLLDVQQPIPTTSPTESSIPSEAPTTHPTALPNNTTSMPSSKPIPSIGLRDSFGYIYLNDKNECGPRFDWIDISNETLVANFDDKNSFTYKPFGEFVTLGGPDYFDFYGVQHSSVLPNTNGYISLGMDDGDFYNDPFDDRDLTNDCPLPRYPSVPYNTTFSRIYVFHDDLVMGTTEDSGVFWKYFSICPHTHFEGGCNLFQWHEAMLSPFNPYKPIFNFEVILFENGDILFQYSQQTNSRSATVGIQEGSEIGESLIGNMYACNEHYINGDSTAILFTTATEFCDAPPSSLPSSVPLPILPSPSPSFSNIFPSSLPSPIPSHILDPTTLPSSEPSMLPRLDPTMLPSSEPSMLLRLDPTSLPSSEPSMLPSLDPTTLPSSEPSMLPSLDPTTLPSSEPSMLPKLDPTTLPSSEPSMLLTLGKECEDDPKFRHVFKSGKKLKCGWFSRKEESYIKKKCKIKNVLNGCKKTCSKCGGDGE